MNKINRLWKNRPALVKRERYELMTGLEKDFKELLLLNKKVIGNKDIKRIIRNKHIYLDEEPIFVHCEFIDCVIRNKSEEALSCRGSYNSVIGCHFTAGYGRRVKGPAMRIEK